MKKLHKIISLGTLLISCVISVFNYFALNNSKSSSSVDLVVNKLILIILINLLFLGILFLTNITVYRRIFLITLTLFAIIWLIEFLTWAYLDVIPLSYIYSNLWEVYMFLSFLILGQGLIFYIVYHIKKNTAKYVLSKHRLHLHEGFVGLIFLIVSVALLWLRSSLLFLTDILWKRLSIILFLVQILLFIFLYIGSFFFFRDIHDVLKLKFIEKIKIVENSSQSNEITVFKRITKDDLHFFKFPKLVLFPFGIVLTVLGLNLIVYDYDFLQINIFDLENEFFVLLGYFLSFVAGGLIGRDWLRLFKKIYPEIYGEIERAIINLEKE